MAKSSKSIVVVSDVHDGGSTAVCSEHPYNSEMDSEYKPNKLQRVLNRAWYDCIDDLEQKPTLLVVNGEPCDGGNPKQNGQQSWSTNVYDQLNDAAILLGAIPYDNLMFVRGSKYHVQVEGTNFEEITAKQLNADAYRAYGGSGKTDYQANIEVHGKIFNVTHHVGYARWWQYRPTSIAQEMVKMHFDHAKRKFHTDAMIRSHVHYYCQVKFLNTIALTTPAWKLPDPFMYRNGLPMMPDVGLIEAIIDQPSLIERPIIIKGKKGVPIMARIFSI